MILGVCKTIYKNRVRFMKSGIYKIKCKSNNSFYIGRASSIKNRKSRHFSQLRKNKHFNKRLQRTFNKYGIESFVFEVLEYCEQSQLKNREQFYLNKYFSNKKCLNLKNESDVPTTSGKNKVKVNQFDLDGNFIKSWESCTEAGLSLGKDPSKIISCKNKNRKSAYGFLWSAKNSVKKYEISKPKFSEDMKNQCRINGLKRAIKINQFDLNNNFVDSWDSINKAEKSLGISNIKKCLNGEYKQVGGFIWKRNKEEDEGYIKN